jgi:hypothetical protein
MITAAEHSKEVLFAGLGKGSCFCFEIPVSRKRTGKRIQGKGEQS